MSFPAESKHLLFNVCNKCGHLYYWCPHINTSHKIGVSHEEARVAAAKMFLAAECDPDSDYARVDWKGLAEELGVSSLAEGQ